jgi:hypothetical protein
VPSVPDLNLALKHHPDRLIKHGPIKVVLSVLAIEQRSDRFDGLVDLAFSNATWHAPILYLHGVVQPKD